MLIKKAKIERFFSVHNLRFARCSGPKRSKKSQEIKEININISSLLETYIMQNCSVRTRKYGEEQIKSYNSLAAPSIGAIVVAFQAAAKRWLFIIKPSDIT